jgi:HAD superfamily hydrolase (TIGR01549 family)
LAINSIAEQHGFEGQNITQFDIDQLRQLETIDIFRRFHIGKEELPVVIPQLQQILGAQIASLEVVSGMREALLGLNEANIKMGILSSNSVENISSFLERNRINVFDFIHAGTFSNKGEILNNIIQKMNYNPNDVFYIGDETRDIIASREANTHSVAVTWGFNAKEILVKHKPDYLIESPPALHSFFISTSL